LFTWTYIIALDIQEDSNLITVYYINVIKVPIY